MKAIKYIVAGVALWAVSNWAWDKYGAKVLELAGLGPASGGSGGSGDAGAASGGSTGGAGGSGGSGGSGGLMDASSLAAAIQALANGVQVPAILTAQATISAAGTTALLPATSGRRYCVLGYYMAGPSIVNANFRSGSSATNLWRLTTSTPAGNSGANLATAWPGYLFSTQPGEALNFVTDAACDVSISYWSEATA